MEVPGGHDNKKVILLYEFICTSMLAFAVLASGGNNEAVVTTVFVLTIIAGPVSGAHFNPATSIAVYVNRR
jgi:glycerol uptake facilitator-like aquaporin